MLAHSPPIGPKPSEGSRSVGEQIIGCHKPCKNLRPLVLGDQQQWKIYTFGLGLGSWVGICILGSCIAGVPLGTPSAGIPTLVAPSDATPTLVRSWTGGRFDIKWDDAVGIKLIWESTCCWGRGISPCGCGMG